MVMHKANASLSIEEHFMPSKSTDFNEYFHRGRFFDMFAPCERLSSFYFFFKILVFLRKNF